MALREYPSFGEGAENRSAEFAQRAVQVGERTGDFAADRGKLREMLMNLRNAPLGRAFTVGDRFDA